jgi:hypothetical protein
VKIEIKVIGEDIKKVVLTRPINEMATTLEVFDEEGSDKPLITARLSLSELQELFNAVKAIKELVP